MMMDLFTHLSISLYLFLLFKYFRWVLWLYTSNKRGEDQWRHSYVPAHTVGTVEEFWKLHRYIGDNPFAAISGTGDVSFFKKGIEPAWEDPSVRDGGRWTLRFPRRLIIRAFWLHLLLLCIGEQLSPSVCGVGCSLRAKYVKVSVWFRKCDDAHIDALGIHLVQLARSVEDDFNASSKPVAVPTATTSNTDDDEDLPPGIPSTNSASRWSVQEATWEDFVKKSRTKQVDFGQSLSSDELTITAVNDADQATGGFNALGNSNLHNSTGYAGNQNSSSIAHNKQQNKQQNNNNTSKEALNPSNNHNSNKNNASSTDPSGRGFALLAMLKKSPPTAIVPEKSSSQQHKNEALANKKQKNDKQSRRSAVAVGAPGEGISSVLGVSQSAPATSQPKNKNNKNINKGLNDTPGRTEKKEESETTNKNMSTTPTPTPNKKVGNPSKKAATTQESKMEVAASPESISSSGSALTSQAPIKTSQNKKKDKLSTPVVPA